jgi:hypothetical protein
VDPGVLEGPKNRIICTEHKQDDMYRTQTGYVQNTSRMICTEHKQDDMYRTQAG